MKRIFITLSIGFVVAACDHKKGGEKNEAEPRDSLGLKLEFERQNSLAADRTWTEQPQNAQVLPTGRGPSQLSQMYGNAIEAASEITIADVDRAIEDMEQTLRSEIDAELTWARSQIERRELHIAAGIDGQAIGAEPTTSVDEEVSR